MGFTYRTIAEHLNCTFRDISPRSRLDGHLKKIGRSRKITLKILSVIETLSCLDASLTNHEILTRVEARWPTITRSESSISHERIKLGFHWRQLLVKQDLSVMQQHQHLQFALDLTKKRIDANRIIFSDESRFVLGDDNRRRQLCRGDWNETAFVTKTEFPISLMIWG
jgi:hypothetical protein